MIRNAITVQEVAVQAASAVMLPVNPNNYIEWSVIAVLFVIICYMVWDERKKP